MKSGELICNEKYIDIKRSYPTYKWVIEKMNKLISNKANTKYPIWCWVKCYNGICPPKHKGERVEGFDVKITFNKPEEKYLEICKEIRKTFDRCITKDSDILQGCVWNIKLSEVEKIEILPKDDGYIYGSLNYKRSNGKRIDWRKEFYKRI